MTAQAPYQRTGRKRDGTRIRAVRKLTLHPGRKLREVEIGRALYPPEEDHERPRTRAECVDGPRPCPYVSCKHHLYLDVTGRGSLTLNFPDLEPDELAESCVLDVADGGGATLEETGDALNLTREMARKLELSALAKLKGAPGELVEYERSEGDTGEPTRLHLRLLRGG